MLLQYLCTDVILGTYHNLVSYHLCSLFKLNQVRNIPYLCSSLTLNLRVPDDGADKLESLATCPLNFHVGVTQYLNQFRHNVGKAR